MLTRDESHYAAARPIDPISSFNFALLLGQFADHICPPRTGTRDYVIDNCAAATKGEISPQLSRGRWLLRVKGGSLGEILEYQRGNWL